MVECNEICRAVMMAHNSVLYNLMELRRALTTTHILVWWNVMELCDDGTQLSIVLFDGNL